MSSRTIAAAVIAGAIALSVAAAQAPLAPGAGSVGLGQELQPDSRGTELRERPSRAPDWSEPAWIDVDEIAPGSVEAAIEASRRRFHRLFLERGVAGLQAAVSIDGRLVWAEGFGYADVEQRVPMWPHTKMRVGSVSKSITAVALGVLVEEGKLDLDAEIQQYVPGFPVKEYPITVRQVAGHLAGIRHYRGAEFLSANHYDSVVASLEIFAADPLQFEPGTEYSYSSYGWNLLSAVIEGASGERFLDFMREWVFEPLEMTDTVADDNARILAQRSRFYVRSENGRLRNAPYVDNSVKWAGGGFLSTAMDLLKFGEGLLEGRVLEPETLDLLWASQSTRDGERTGYGIGWEEFWNPAAPPEAPSTTAPPFGVQRELLRRYRMLGHGGGSIGGITSFVVLPDQRVVATAISNTSGVDDLGRDLHFLTAAMAAEVASWREAHPTAAVAELPP